MTVPDGKEDTHARTEMESVDRLYYDTGCGDVVDECRAARLGWRTDILCRPMEYFGCGLVGALV